MLDLGLIVADKNMDFALRGILKRHKALGIRHPITFQTVPLPGRDGGVRTGGPEALDRLRGEVSHGIIMLDWEGSGADSKALDLEKELDHRLRQTWGNQAKAIVIEPELDVWIWGSSNAMNQSLNCEIPDIRVWLTERGYEFDRNEKPVRPKEAIESLLFELKEPRSSALYQEIISRISLARCVDPAFVRLKTTLRHWFA